MLNDIKTRSKSNHVQFVLLFINVCSSTTFEGSTNSIYLHSNFSPVNWCCMKRSPNVLYVFLLSLEFSKIEFIIHQKNLNSWRGCGGRRTPSRMIQTEWGFCMDYGNFRILFSCSKLFNGILLYEGMLVR